jgi:hypothetical protein
MPFHAAAAVVQCLALFSVTLKSSYVLLVQASMTQLLLYYTRMLELLKKQGPEGMALAREGVNIPAIMYEIKRITKA